MEKASSTSRRGAHAVAIATTADLEGVQRDSCDADHAVSRLAARRAIAAMGLDPRSFDVMRRAGAAPAVVAESAAGVEHELALSLTHRDGRGAAMVADAPARIGIDLEREDAVTPEHARYFLTAAEQRALRTSSAATLWALKEAAWKALALGDDVCFLGLELHVDSRGRVRSVSVHGARLPATSHVERPWPGYVLATVEVGADR